jgi:hypothetical protein
MRLELWTYEVSDVRLGARTRLDDRVLEIDARELRELLCRDPVIADVRVELARPDEPVRIIHILDSIARGWRRRARTSRACSRRR